jgi:hypothetical protein
MFIGAGRIDTVGEGEKSPREKVVVGKTVKRNERDADKDKDNVTEGRRRRKRLKRIKEK